MYGPLFTDRRDAGRQLAALLSSYADDANVLVLGLPRGGVPVAFEVATALGAPLDIFVVRKLGVPGQEELAMGAVASGGTLVLNHDVLAMLRLPRNVIEAIVARERAELERRETRYRAGRPPPQLQGRTVILVDDGIATGASVRAAVEAARQQQPAAVIIAAPVIAEQTQDALRRIADDVVCVAAPAALDGVGRWYGDFAQTQDDEVEGLLDAASPADTSARGTGAE